MDKNWRFLDIEYIVHIVYIFRMEKLPTILLKKRRYDRVLGSHMALQILTFGGLAWLMG